jgi:hypothetical protein
LTAPSTPHRRAPPGLHEDGGRSPPIRPVGQTPSILTPYYNSVSEDAKICARKGARNAPAIDADLARIVQAWPALPAAIRRAVVAMIGAVGDTTAGQRARRDALRAERPEGDI